MRVGADYEIDELLAASGLRTGTREAPFIGSDHLDSQSDSRDLQSDTTANWQLARTGKDTHRTNCRPKRTRPGSGGRHRGAKRSSMTQPPARLSTARPLSGSDSLSSSRLHLSIACSSSSRTRSRYELSSIRSTPPGIRPDSPGDGRRARVRPRAVTFDWPSEFADLHVFRDGNEKAPRFRCRLSSGPVSPGISRRQPNQPCRP